MVSNYIRKTDKASYSREKLQAAVRAVKNGELSGYKASQEYKIPRMTIMDHVNNKRTKSNSLGRNTALPLQVEKELALGLHLMEKHGFGLTKTEMLEMVADFVIKNKISTPFKNGEPGNTWFTAFKKRHHLSVKKPQAVEYARKKAVNPFIVYEYFNLLEKTLKDLNLLDKPSAIWNLDETSFSKDPDKTKIVGLKGHAATRVIASPGKDNTTVLLGINALGEKMPPLIIYKGKHMWDEWTSPEAYPGTTYAATKNGWMESEVFETYFRKVFILNIGDERPVLLIYDGHATHMGLNIIEEARKADITILKLPAHTSHVLQPLDVAVMKSYKDRWDQLLVKWQRLNVGVTLSKKEFTRLIGEVWTQIDSQVLKNGFRKTGIYPFNPKAVDEKQFDLLKLEQWKNIQKLESQQKLEHISHSSPKECPNFDVKVEQSTTKSDPKTLFSLAFNCVSKMVHRATSEERDSQQHLDSNHFPMSNSHDKNESELENGKLLKHQIYEATKSTNKDISNCVSDGKKIHVLDDRTLTFEELLLMKVKAGNNTKVKRQRMAPGAEVITHDDVLRRKREEKIKIIKKEPKEIEIKRKILMEPGPSSSIKKPASREQQQQTIKSKKGKGKKSCVVQKQQKKVIKSKKKKRPEVASDDSTSVSDCLSEYSDSDISDYSDTDICDGEQNFEEDVSTAEEIKILKILKKYKSKSLTVKEIPEIVCSKLVEESKDVEENSKFETENNENGGDSNNVISEKYKLIHDYGINDIVLVRYLVRQKWTYYVGYVEEVTPGDDEIYYSITFYKTVKKPLKFILTKKRKDYDNVPSLSVVKKIGLCQNPDNPKEFLLSNDDDAIYFL